MALTNVTMPYAKEIADKGLEQAVKENKALAKGVNVIHGHVTYKAVAESLDLPYTPLDEVMG